MIPRVARATVLGAGTMGAQIACLLAGAGARVRLLDLDADVARRGLERAARLRPSPSYVAADLDRIRPGGFDELEDAAVDADWVIEAVVEEAGPKRALFERLEAALAGRAAADWPTLTSNTSGLSIAGLADGRSGAFRAAFLGSHFFNPPRYARLLELIPLPETDADRLARLEAYAGRHLGKGTVRAKDTPAFIANRLGVHGLLTALELATELGLGVDEVDELTGSLVGRPKSATFRTLDLVGLDVAVAVADHCHADLEADPERERFAVPPILRILLERGALGEKAGAGFYRREGGEVLALDLATLEYRPRRRLAAPSLELARLERDPGRRLAALVAADDIAGRFLWRALSAGLVYAATVAGEIADDAETVDRAMRWGFGWERGPFEAWDALGPARVVARLRDEGRPVPPLAAAVAGGPGCFHEDGHSLRFADLAPVAVPATPGGLDLDIRRAAVPGLPSNAAASLVDLGGGILGLELHGKLNVIGTDTIALGRRAVERAATTYDGLVVGTRAADLSVGANLALLLLEAEEGEWRELDAALRAFQALVQAIRYSPVPVVVAPRGRTLGGGAELCLAAPRTQPLAETYIGLVETGVGLIPAGGGTTALARHVAAAAGAGPGGGRGPGEQVGDAFGFFQAALTAVAMARVATSAEEARELGYIGPADLVTANPDRQWADAAETARLLAEAGYRPPAPRPIAVLGRRGLAAAEALTYNQLAAHQMSEHDRRVVLALAGVMSGGDVAEGTPLGEQYLLDLEREAFLRLLGEPLTRARIRHTLKTGKPLRN